MAERVAIFISTPAQFHFYKNIVDALEKRGVEVRLLIRDYGETLEVLERYDGFVFSKVRTNWDRIYKLPADVIRARNYLKDFKPDLVTGFEIYAPYTAKLLGTRSFVFYDSEPRVNRLLSVQIRAYMPFVDAVITPQAFRDDLGKKHMKIRSFKEFAYLHPKYFTPDRGVVEELGPDENEFAVVRFNAFDAAHDVGVGGFSFEEKLELVRKLEKYVDVYVSYEGGDLPSELRDYLLTVSKKKIHSVLHFARLLVTDTQTMATEAAILGTPTVRCNRFVGENDMGNFIELEKRYGLLVNVGNAEMAIEIAEELVQSERVKKEWLNKRGELIRDCIDITEFMVWLIENYPESLDEFRQNPDVQYRFR